MARFLFVSICNNTAGSQLKFGTQHLPKNGKNYLNSMDIHSSIPNAEFIRQRRKPMKKSSIIIHSIFFLIIFTGSSVSYAGEIPGIIEMADGNYITFPTLRKKKPSMRGQELNQSGSSQQNTRCRMSGSWNLKWLRAA